MAEHVQRLPHGVTARSYDPGTAPWETQPDQYWTDTEGTLHPVVHQNWLERNMWWLAPAGLAAGGLGAAALSGGGGAGAAGASGAASSAAAAPAVNWAAAPSASSLFAPTGLVGTAAAPGATTASVTAATAAAAAKAGLSHSVTQQLLQLAKDPKTYAGFAALLPGLLGGRGGDSPFGGDTSGLMNEATKSLELQRHRVEQAQPVYDTLVNMAYGSSPMSYRGSAPAGYRENGAPEGAYAYQGPRFGKNG